LRGLLAADPAVLGGLARVLVLGGTLSMLVSSTARDAAAGVEPIDRRALDALAGAYHGHGLALTRTRPATPADVAASRSSWGKRLGAGARRPAWRLEATRVPPAVS
jgi:16S rRNA (adenine(1408)-N(1))-methyltransferase